VALAFRQRLPGKPLFLLPWWVAPPFKDLGIDGEIDHREINRGARKISVIVGFEILKGGLFQPSIPPNRQINLPGQP